LSASKILLMGSASSSTPASFAVDMIRLNMTPDIVLCRDDIERHPRHQFWPEHGWHAEYRMLLYQSVIIKSFAWPRSTKS
jgi:hypothetical protein